MSRRLAVLVRSLALPLASRTEGADSAVALERACAALWLATLSLMTAFMQTQAPAHRWLLARRIARNLRTLREQECFSADCRERFARLAQRWEGHAGRLAPHSDASSPGSRGLLGTDESVSAGLSRVRTHVKIGAPNATASQLRQLVQWADQHSPVGCTIRESPDTMVEIEIA